LGVKLKISRIGAGLTLLLKKRQNALLPDIGRVFGVSKTITGPFDRNMLFLKSFRDARGMGGAYMDGAQGPFFCYRKM